MDTLRHASGLAIGLAQDAALSVRRGRWAYNPGEHILQVGLADALLDPRQRGLIGHEIGHVRISYYHLFRRAPGVPIPILANLLNAIEDPRVNSWFCHCYPGGAEWMQAVHEDDRAAQLPPTRSLFLQFASAASIADAWEWREPQRWALDMRVTTALRETAVARQRYAIEELPTEDLDQEFAEEDLAQVLLREVEPLLAPDRELPPRSTRATALRVISAARAYRLFEASILPVVTRLIERDLAVLAGRTETDPRFRRALEAAVLSGGAGLVELVERGLAGDDEAKPGELERVAYVGWLAGRQRLEPAAGWSRIDGAADMVEDPAGTARRGHAAVCSGGLDGKIADVLRSQLVPLVHDLRLAFRRPTSPRYSRGFPTGNRVDMHAAMRFSIDRRGHDRLWQRARSTAFTPEAAVFLLVDLSGSMSGEKIEAAIVGTSLLARALGELGNRVRFAVEGFQDEKIPFKSFDEPVTNALLDRFKEMALEVAGHRPGGHNHPRYNDDGPCLREAAAELLSQSCPQRLMLVVSDGRPAGRRGNADDLHSAVAEASRHLHIVGLGLGEGTGHVKEFYPHAVADIPSDELARAIGNVVAKALNGKRR